MVALLLLFIALLLIIACGVFVAAEFALIAVNRNTVSRLAAKGDIKAKRVEHALATLSTQLSSAQVGITITNLAIGFLAEPAIAELIDTPLRAIGIPNDAVSGVALLIGLILATVLTMVFGELVPKNFALAKPLATTRFIETPLLLFTRVMKYPIVLLNGSANYLLRQVGVEPQEELASARSADELLSLVRRSAEKGTLAKETAQMLERSLNFSDLTALDAMTPRVRVKDIRIEQSVAVLLELAKSTGFSRFPVYDDTLDNILGVAHIKHAFSIPREERSTTPVSQIMRQPVLVPSSVQLEPLLENLKTGGLQMAIVVDEFGAVDGIVTIEDLLEELVGEVKDEHDHSGVTIRKRADGSWLISGLLRPDEIGEMLNIYIPEEEEVETIAGLVTHHLEHIPKVGEQVVLQAVDRNGTKQQVQLRIERMDSHRIDRLQMNILPAHSEQEMES